MRSSVPIRLRWSDIDAYGHVNNAAMLGLLEEARIQMFWIPASDAAAEGPAVLDGSPGAATSTVVAHQEVQYLRPIPYGRAPVMCELWVGRIGGSSLEVHYEVWSPDGVEPRVLMARARTTVVVIDAATGRPQRIGDRERAAWQPYLEDPIDFGRR